MTLSNIHSWPHVFVLSAALFSAPAWSEHQVVPYAQMTLGEPAKTLEAGDVAFIASPDTPSATEAQSAAGSRVLEGLVFRQHPVTTRDSYPGKLVEGWQNAGCV